MRSVLLALALLAACRASAADATSPDPASVTSRTVRIASWNVHNFPSGKMNLRGEPAEEAARIKAVANQLRPLKPDVIVLQEIRDGEVAEALAGELADLGMKSVVCGRWKDDYGVLSFQQVAILARIPASDVYWGEWQSDEKHIDPPRGYAFATFAMGSSTVTVFGVHLKSNVTRGSEATANIQKRESAIEQLIGLVDRDHSNRIVVVCGDFNTQEGREEWKDERTLRLLTERDFIHGYGTGVANVVSCPSNGRYPDALFDYIFVRPSRLHGGSRTIDPVPRELSDHNIVLGILEAP